MSILTEDIKIDVSKCSLEEKRHIVQLLNDDGLGVLTPEDVRDTWRHLYGRRGTTSFLNYGTMPSTFKRVRHKEYTPELVLNILEGTTVHKEESEAVFVDINKAGHKRVGITAKDSPIPDRQRAVGQFYREFTGVPGEYRAYKFNKPQRVSHAVMWDIIQSRDNGEEHPNIVYNNLARTSLEEVQDNRYAILKTDNAKYWFVPEEY